MLLFLRARLKEPSSKVSIGVFVSGICNVIVDWQDMKGWAQIFGGIAGFVTSEGK